MTVDREDRRPLPEQLAAILRDRIAAGERVLPSVSRLAAEHDLAEVTVKKALAILKAEGLIVTVPGRGTFAR